MRPKYTDRLAAALMLAAPFSCMALDLTPVRSERELEGGFKAPVLQFIDGDKKVTYSPPRGWEIRGSQSVLELLPSDPPQAIARFSIHARTTQTGDLTGPGQRLLEKWLPTLLPKDSEQVTIQEVNETPFPFGPYSSREYNFLYHLAGQKFSRSLCVVDLNTQDRLVIEISSRSKDFQNVRDTVIRSLARWRWEKW